MSEKIAKSVWHFLGPLLVLLISVLLVRYIADSDSSLRAWRVWLKVSLCLIGGAALLHVLPLRIGDRYCLAPLICLFNADFDRESWHACCVDRLRVLRVFLFGVVLIILIPFGFLWKIVPGLLTINGIPNPSVNIFELWAVAVCMWSVVFMFYIFVVDHPDHYDHDSQKRSAKELFRIAIGSFLLWLLVSCSVYYLIMLEGQGRPALQILGECLVVVLFCGFDLYLYYCYQRTLKTIAPAEPSRERRLRGRAKEFLLFLLIVDAPALIGFGILGILLLTRPADKNWATPFVAGASAFSLIVVNTVYLVVYFVERYRGTTRMVSALICGSCGLVVYLERVRGTVPALTCGNCAQPLRKLEA